MQLYSCSYCTTAKFWNLIRQPHVRGGKCHCSSCCKNNTRCELAPTRPGDDSWKNEKQTNITRGVKLWELQRQIRNVLLTRTTLRTPHFKFKRNGRTNNFRIHFGEKATTISLVRLNIQGPYCSTSNGWQNCHSGRTCLHEPLGLIYGSLYLIIVRIITFYRAIGILYSWYDCRESVFLFFHINVEGSGGVSEIAAKESAECRRPGDDVRPFRVFVRAVVARTYSAVKIAGKPYDMQQSTVWSIQDSESEFLIDIWHWIKLSVKTNTLLSMCTSMSAFFCINDATNKTNISRRR